MNKSENAKNEINSIYELNEIDSYVRRLSPVSKLLITIIYLLIVISINKYDLQGIIILIVYPAVMYTLSHIKMSTCLYKLRYVLPIVMMVGIFNPILDRQVIEVYGISGGLISMITLMLKGVYCLLASFILIATTPIEEICYALRKLKVPSFITSLFLLTYRYVFVLLDEVSVMLEAYKLRAPNQKGIHISAWGTFLGQLILRTMDKGSALYESMELRGFKGEFYYLNEENNKSLKFVILMMILLIILKMYNYIVFMIGVLIG